MNTDPASFVERFVTGLGFVLAIDNCARGCTHCPAFGSKAPVERADLHRLEDWLRFLTDLRRSYGLSETWWDTVHCWRISDPLDYTARLPASNGIATVADVASLWREHLHQGLYVVTNGSEGRPHARRALQAFAALPRLVSQIKLTITPADRAWGTDRYIEHMAADLRILQPLWELPANRFDTDLEEYQLRLNVKSTAADQPAARAVTAMIMRRAGVSPALIDANLDDLRRVKFKPIYDLGTATGEPTAVDGAIDITAEDGTRHKPTPRSRVQYGIRPNGVLFEVDMHAFTETDLRHETTGEPHRLNHILTAVDRAGWR